MFGSGAIESVRQVVVSKPGYDPQKPFFVHNRSLGTFTRLTHHLLSALPPCLVGTHPGGKKN